MTDREVIAQLKSSPPRPELTRWQQAARVLAVVFAGIAVLALVTALYAVQRAASGPGRVADCMNRTLGIRQQFTDADHANERQKIADQSVAEKDKARGLTELQLAKTRKAAVAGFRLYQRGVAEFVASLDDWTIRDKAITAERAKHPLGKC